MVSSRQQNTSFSFGQRIACRFIPAKKRQAWIALNNLQQELLGTYQSNLDTEVRSKKLLWWLEELVRMRGNQPRHPLTNAVNKACSTLLASPSNYQEITESWSELITLPVFEWINQNDLIHYCQISSGVFEQLKAQILLGYEPQHQLKEFILFSNQAHIQINLLRDFGLHLRSNRLPLPLSELNSLNLISQDVMSWRKESQASNWETISSKLVNQADGAIKKAQQWISPLPKNEKQSLWINQVALRIDSALLDEIKNSNCAVISQYIDLTPIRTIGVVLKSKLTI